MKKIPSLILAMLTTFLCGYGQFQHSFGKTGGELGQSVQLTQPDSGYIIAGATSADFFEPNDATLVKTDQNGNTIWSAVYGGENNDYFSCVRQVGSSTSLPEGYVAVGGTNSMGFGSVDAYLVRTDAAGTPIFSRVYGGIEMDAAYCIQPTKIPNVGPGYIIVGESRSFSSIPGSKTYVILTDEWGTVVKSVVLGYLGDQAGNWIEPTSDGGYILVGSNTYQCGDTAQTANDIYVVKLDGNLIPQWDRTIGGGSDLLDRGDFGYCVKEDTYKQAYIITGITQSFSPNIYGEAYLLSLSLTGGFNYLLTYGLEGQDAGNSIILTSNAQNTVDYVVAGSVSLPYNNYYIGNALMFKTDQGGTPYWARYYGQQGGEIACEVHNAATPNDQQGFVFAGYTNSFGAGYQDIYLVETDFNGKSGSPCEQEIKLNINKHIPCISESTKYEFVDAYNKVESKFNYIEYKVDKCSIIQPLPNDTITKSAVAHTQASSGKVVISPNPAKGQVNIQLPAGYSEGSIRIVNTQGATVTNYKAIGNESKAELNIGNLPNGLYLVEIKKNGNQRPEYYKLIKE